MTKKRFLYLTIILLHTVGSVSGQTKMDSLYYFSISAGLNMSKNIDIDSITSGTYLPYFGLIVNKDLNSKFVFGGGLMYSMKGSNIYSVLNSYRFQYFDVHALLKYKMSKNLNIFAGIEPSFLIKATRKIADEVKNKTNSFDKWELNIPIGVEFAFQKNWFLSLKYDIPNPKCKYNNIRLGLNVYLSPDLSTSKIKTRKSTAITDILTLKEGALFVRLSSSGNKIKYYTKVGNLEEAQHIKNQQDSINKLIIRAFRNNFKFCPVYFFIAENSDLIRSRKFDGVFINDSLKQDSSFKPQVEKFYTAEFGTLESGERVVEDGSDSLPISYRENGSNLGVYALRIMDSNFIQLEDPFPYYVKVYDFMARRSYNEIVFLMNKRLFSYYKK